MSDPRVARAALEQGPLFRYGELFEFRALYDGYVPAILKFEGYSYSVLVRRGSEPRGATIGTWAYRL